LSCYPIQVAGRHIQMGPALAPQQKPCFSCLKHALLQNRPLEIFLNNHPKSTTNVSPGYHTVPILSSLALNIVSLQLAKEFSHTVSNNTLVSIDLFDLKREEHHVRTLPQCSTCGDPGIYTRQVQGVIKLKDVQRRNSSYGGFRLCTAEETWNNCRHLISPLTGIITHLHSRESRGSSLRHIWESSCSVNPQHNRRDKTESFIKKSYGKGQTFDQARVSAICETLERHAAVYQGSEPKILSSYDKMEKAIEPQTLLNFSDSQHRNRVHTDIIKEQVSDCYDHQGVLSWTPTWSLTENCTKYLPLSYCYSLAPSEENEILIPFSTIGNATGNCLEVAIIQGFLELVERDAAAIWWYNRLQRPEINLESFENPYFNALKQQYTELGWNIWCLDLTHDFEIPVIIAFAENDQGEFYGGLGCHFDLSLAVQRALTELNQLFSPHENHPPNFIKSDIETPLFLYPSQEIRHADFYPPHPYQSLKDDIYYCRDKVTELGMEMLVLNYSRPDINMSTAKVIVPGMSHFWKRLGPGRLYEVPLKLKWLDRCLTEPEMNTQVFPL
ncbi:MAG: TOMM precursor leader peptide-binding protein, partial [Lentisphaeraceae bacterium]|nr:TOMM precursor leader peptide-binding protein [Lentisphaeraceae bacterium]